MKSYYGCGFCLAERSGPISNVKIQNLKQLPEPVSFRSHDEASTSSSMTEKETRNSLEDDLSPRQQAGSSDVSPQSRARKMDSLSLPCT